LVQVIPQQINVTYIFNEDTIVSGDSTKGTYAECSWLISDNIAYCSDPLNDKLLSFLKKEYPSSFSTIGFLPLDDNCKSLWSTVATGSSYEKEELVNQDTAEALLLLEDILSAGASAGVSDIHIYPGMMNKIEVRFRVDGSLIPYTTYPASIHASLERVLIEGNDFCHTILSTLTPQPGSFEHKGLSYRVERIPVGRNFKGKLVIRQFNPENSLASLEDFGLSQKNIHLIKKATSRLGGIILTTGPTGSGKSTMLLAAVHAAMTAYPDRSYSSLEDPIEQVVDGMTQIQVNKNISFSDGLRSLKRQDPDVILVGEIRDQETADLAVNASITGHLVLSTKHTTNAHKVFDSFREMGIYPSMIAQAISLIISQRLVKQLCSTCKSGYFLSEHAEHSALYGEILDPDAKGGVQIFKAGKGCSACQGTGYKGRIAIFELLKVTPEVEDFIIQNSPMNQLRRRSIEDGSFSDIWIDALDKVKKGITSIKAVEALLPQIELDRPHISANTEDKLIN
jgi:type II secretory ATPase GspE/PulE/Tfp pilus assembly ATPase PilB-like protein